MVLYLILNIKVSSEASEKKAVSESTISEPEPDEVTKPEEDNNTDDLKGRTPSPGECRIQRGRSSRKSKKFRKPSSEVAEPIYACVDKKRKASSRGKFYQEISYSIQ